MIYHFYIESTHSISLLVNGTSSCGRMGFERRLYSIQCTIDAKGYITSDWRLL